MNLFLKLHIIYWNWCNKSNVYNVNLRNRYEGENMDNTKLKEYIQNLINEGKIIKQTEYHSNFEPGVIMLPYISGEKYDMWMNDIKIFATRNLEDHQLYKEVIETYNTHNNQWGTTAYDNMMSYLRSIEKDEDYWSNYKKTMEIFNIKNCTEKSIFVSHSSLDIEYVKTFITLLENIGFAGSGKIFCSSLSGYYIPNGESIYEYLKKRLNADTYVIMILSENYYASPACMNEMGAGWVTSKEYSAILVPGFEYSNIRGAIDASRIWFKLNDKERLNDFKDNLINNFRLNSIDSNIWERKRDEYLQAINGIYEANKFKNFKQQVEVEDVVDFDINNIRCIFRFVNNENTQTICKNIDLVLTDYNDEKVSINLKYNQLKSYIVYSKENKRVIIDIDKNTLENISKFDFNNMKTFIVDSRWSTYTQ